MIMEKLLCLLVCVFTILHTCNGQNLETLNKVVFGMSALYEKESCWIADLDKETEGVLIYCDKEGYVIGNGESCVVKSDDTETTLLFTYTCEEGHWKLAKGTNADNFHRHKRYWWVPLIAFVAIVFIAVVTYCVTRDNIKTCRDEEIEVKELIPPKYTNCPPSDIESVYVASAREKTVRIKWSDPIGHAEHGIKSNTQTCCDESKNGGFFDASPAPAFQRLVLYTITDEIGQTGHCSFYVTAKYLTCSAPTIPDNGKLQRCSHEYLWGSTCYFNCLNGYEITEQTDNVTCLETEVWDSLSPTCSKVMCGEPFNITYGNVFCNDGHSFESFCTFRCHHGFSLGSSPRGMKCKADKSWSVSSDQVTCSDNEAPRISCNKSQIFYADKGVFSTTVKWDIPTATDNFDTKPSILKLSGPTLGDELHGLHYVEYRATDSLGNYSPLSECTIAIDVKVIKCSKGPTDSLNNSRFMMYNCSAIFFYNGVSCNMSCDLNLSLNSSSLGICERHGSTDEGVWVWSSGEEPFCNVVSCPPLHPPKNGLMVSNTVQARPVRVMFCESGFDIPPTVGPWFVGRLSCQDDGSWYPIDSFPDCIVPIPGVLLLNSKLYYEGDCNDNATLADIKDQILIYLETLEADVDNSICPSIETCITDNLIVECGETSTRNRRNDHKVSKRETGYIVVSWDIGIIFNKRNRNTTDAYRYLSEILDDISNATRLAVSEGELDIDGFSLAADAFQTGEYAYIKCQQQGYTLHGLTCKPCPSGTYLSAITENCEYCKIGEFMDHPGAVACEACEEGYSTLSFGTKHISSCIKKCKPGFYSSTTFEPCSVCPIGSYQDVKGSTSCKQCPPGQITSSTNSSSAHLCSTFDLLFKDVPDPTKLVSIMLQNSGVMTLLMWVKHQSLLNADTEILLTSSNVHFFSLMINESVKLNSSNVYESDKVLTNKRWTSIILTLDIPGETVQLYMDGVRSFQSTGILLDSFDDCDVRIKTFNGNGLFMSRLSVHDRSLNLSEILTLTQSCSAVIAKMESLGTIHQILSDNIIVTAPSTCDAIDECRNMPCGTHTCINKVDGFTCVCNGDMTGALCNIEPDYCEKNECTHGVCIPDNGTYTCICKQGYVGAFCDIPPVDGAWSMWTPWSECDVSCGGGVRLRNRNCDNPIPGYMGKNCSGKSSETDICNSESCKVCAALERKLNTRTACLDAINGVTVCNMTCANGTFLPSGQSHFQEYRCGFATGYRWEPTIRVPECVTPTGPPSLGLGTLVTYNDSLPVDYDLDSSIKDNLSRVGCVNRRQCTVSTVRDNSSVASTSTKSNVTVQFTIEMTKHGDLGLDTYLTEGIETPSLSELLDAVRALEELGTHIQANASKVFDVEVDGIQYTIDNESLSMTALVECEEGFAGTDGLCAPCTAGTMYSDGVCIYCGLGTYQPSQAQTSCIECPSEYTTQTFGADNVSECSISISRSTTLAVSNDHTETNNAETNDTVIAIVIAICVAVSIVLAVIIGCLVHRRKIGFWSTKEKNGPKRHRTRLTGIQSM